MLREVVNSVEVSNEEYEMEQCSNEQRDTSPS